MYSIPSSSYCLSLIRHPYLSPSNPLLIDVEFQVQISKNDVVCMLIFPRYIATLGYRQNLQWFEYIFDSERG
jgi:hypothetical protein